MTEIDRDDTVFERSDADLIAAVRAGDRDAYGLLWARHQGAAHALARSIGRPSDVEELVSESFTRVLSAISRGGGPDAAFRPYLLSAIRRVAIDLGRSYYTRVSVTDDDQVFELTPHPSAADDASAREERSAVLRAWASLPDSSRQVLWHLTMEGESLATVAPLLGTSPNGVATRAHRAKERLRQAFLQEYVRGADEPACQWPRSRLGAYARGGVSTTDRARIDAHLDTCAQCSAALFDLSDVDSTLLRIVAPAVLGAPAVVAGYLAARHPAAPAAGAPAPAAGTGAARGARTHRGLVALTLAVLAVLVGGTGSVSRPCPRRSVMPSAASPCRSRQPPTPGRRSHRPAQRLGPPHRVVATRSCIRRT